MFLARHRHPERTFAASLADMNGLSFSVELYNLWNFWMKEKMWFGIVIFDDFM
jgi:hypothetical protein